MDKTIAKKYYERPDIQKAILKFAKDREIGVMFDGYFGKRPDVIENLYDIQKFVKNGVMSFHTSEERWANPLLLGNDKLTDEDKAKNRIGWDLILDLDGVDFELSKIVGRIIIDHLKEIGINNISIKFSGNKGFHIGVPWEAFSENIIGIGETRNLFPDVARKIASYLVYELKSKFAREILTAVGSIDLASEKYGIPLGDLISKDEDCLNFDWMKLMEIDTILIASRHLFRAPYSLNEKSGLVSVPLKAEKIMEFQKHWATPERIKPDYHNNYMFLKYNSEYGKDADILLIKSYEDDYIDKISEDISKANENLKTDFEISIDEEVELKDFPPTIKYVLSNNFPDGKKRALFLLLTFLYSINWDKEHIEQTVKEWNQKQDTPLKNNYIKAQISWFNVRQKSLSPPSYDNENYFKQIGIPEDIINKDKTAFKKLTAKNPLHYVYLLLKNKNKGKQKEE